MISTIPHGVAAQLHGDRPSVEELSPELRRLVEIHSCNDPTQRLLNHWVGRTPSVQDWDMPKAVGKAVAAALTEFFASEGLEIHGAMGEDGRPPVFESIETGDGHLQAPQSAAFFLESSQSGERIVITLEKNQVTGARELQVVAADAIDLISRIRERVFKSNYLRGRVFDLEGDIVAIDDVSLQDVILTEHQEASWRLHVLDFSKRIGMMSRIGGRDQRGILLKGPPGCGKSMLLRATAAELQGALSVCLASPRQISAMSGVDELETLIKMTTPVAVFLEEIDIFGKDRSMMHSPHMAELMQLMDGLRNVAGVIWVGTTNRPGEVEEALADRPGRFDRQIEFQPLSESHRARLIERLIRPSAFTNEASELLLRESAGYTGAQIRDVCDTVRLIALSEEGPTDVFGRDFVRHALDDCSFSGYRDFGFARQQISEVSANGEF